MTQFPGNPLKTPGSPASLDYDSEFIPAPTTNLAQKRDPGETNYGSGDNEYALNPEAEGKVHPNVC